MLTGSKWLRQPGMYRTIRKTFLIVTFPHQKKKIGNWIDIGNGVIFAESAFWNTESRCSAKIENDLL